MNVPRFPGLVDILLAHPRRAPEAMAAEVDERLKQVVAYAYEHNAFYRETWERAGFHLKDFSGRRDLPAIPPVDKTRIVDAGPAAYDTTIPPESFHTMSTSGTSGCAITVRRTLLEQRVVRRGYLRTLFRVGARPWHRFVTIASPWLHAHRGLFISRVVRTHHLLPLSSLDEQIKTLQSFRPAGVVGQTGGIYLLARELLRRGMRFPLRFLGPTGATLMPEMARAMREAFAVAPTDLYGAIELGAVAWQCRRGNYHIDADRIVLEIVDDDGNPVPDGTPGQVICTALYAYAMPFIRYRLLDIAAISTRTCNCGCRFPVMERVKGRINDFLPTPRGDLVSPHFFFHLYDHARCNPVKEWRIIQENVDDLVYEYVPEERFDPAALQTGMDLIRRRFGETTRVRAVPIDHVPVLPNGKRTCIVSKLRPTEAATDRPWIRDAAASLGADPRDRGSRAAALVGSGAGEA